MSKEIYLLHYAYIHTYYTLKQSYFTILLVYQTLMLIFVEKAEDLFH